MAHERNRSGRAIDRKGVEPGKLHPAERRTGRLAEPTVCQRCGSVIENRRWRRGRPADAAKLASVRWVTCPGCRQEQGQEYLGRVVVAMLPDDDLQVMQARVRNVAERTGRNQPLRRIVSMERAGATLEILTTSQKLAHRVAKEIAKAFGGRASYGWSDDGSLLARVRR